MKKFRHSIFSRQITKTIFIVGVFSAAPIESNSHPVAFKDSVGIMGHHSMGFSHNQLNYSFQYWVAAGIHHFKRPTLKENNQINLASANFLIKRWNKKLFQANIYGALGAGQGDYTGELEDLSYAMLHFDIEDRHYYFLTKHYQIFSKDLVDLNVSHVRIGLTPYVDGYDGIHSWLILQYEHKEFTESEVAEDLTPLLRVFYRNLLFEIGISMKGETSFNYIAHF